MKGSRRHIRTYPTKRGVRILQHGIVLSEVLRSPGPTHSVVDVMAAAIEVLSPGLQVALLGFSGGGLIGPLRALGARHRVTALDLDDHGFAAFEKLCRRWAGQVRWHQAEAGSWLRVTRRRYDCVAVDLSIEQDGDVAIPDLVWNELPSLVRRRLKPRGLALFNLLRPANLSWKEGLARVIGPYSSAWVVTFEEFENRIVLAGRKDGTARSISREIRTRLRELGSKQADRITVRRFRSN